MAQTCHTLGLSPKFTVTCGCAPTATAVHYIYPPDQQQQQQQQAPSPTCRITFTLPFRQKAKVFTPAISHLERVQPTFHPLLMANRAKRTHTHTSHPPEIHLCCLHEYVDHTYAMETEREIYQVINLRKLPEQLNYEIAYMMVFRWVLREKNISSFFI